MCGACEWEDAATRALDAADALHEWKTNRIDFLRDLASSIEEMEHVTDRQLECIENAEEEST